MYKEKEKLGFVSQGYFHCHPHHIVCAAIPFNPDMKLRWCYRHNYYNCCVCLRELNKKNNPENEYLRIFDL